ncbi:hypothetical protein CDAR_410961 [Caerostris darwini]|uniref:Uncharacterized protein n=1 Tax=Caerostris darwini TaxID=1538125 RepID=A0AAV4SJQ0_9ARAC|nr:hypothetical protein CDAR_410961 [Caerostris darwini]
MPKVAPGERSLGFGVRVTRSPRGKMRISIDTDGLAHTHLITPKIGMESPVSAPLMSVITGFRSSRGKGSSFSRSRSDGWLAKESDTAQRDSPKCSVFAAVERQRGLMTEWLAL